MARVYLAHERHPPRPVAIKGMSPEGSTPPFREPFNRDVKPENILLSGRSALVADFGIARAVSAAGVQTLTDVGQPVGSPAYMSPEQLAGSRAIDARTDVYSLACVLYEMLVGQPPLLDVAEGSAPGHAALDHSLRAQRVGPRTARLITDAMSRALAAQPGARFASVDEFAAHLKGAVVQRRMSWCGAFGHVQQRGLADEHLVQHARQAVDVRPGVDRPAAGELFGAHVRG